MSLLNPFNNPASLDEREFKAAQRDGMLSRADGSDASYYHQLDTRSNLIRWQQEHDEELKRLRLQLKTGGANGGALCNDLLINKCESIVAGYLSKNTINSNYGADETKQVLKDTFNDLVDDMADSYFEYNVKFEDMDIILRIVKNACRSAINRSSLGWTLKTNSQMTKVLETNTQTADANANKSFMGIFQR